MSLLAGEPDDIWAKYQRPYYEFLSFSKKVTAVFRLPMASLKSISPSIPMAFHAGNQVLERYLLEKMTYELPSSQGFVLAQIEGRQIQPKIVKPNRPEDSIFSATWIKLKLENEPAYEDFVGPRYRDVVLYCYKDGLFTIPENEPNIFFKYAMESYEMDEPTLGSYTQNLLSKEEATVFVNEHRTVLRIQDRVLDQELKFLEIPTVVVTYKRMYIPQKNTGYRIRS